jgi:hypothetical protein
MIVDVLRRAAQFAVVLACLSICCAGCTAGGRVGTISQVTYTADSGPILPELQWHERITITGDGVTLARNGKVKDTQVNAGTWELAVDAQAVAALFAQLETVDCAAVKRVEPDDPPDGGGAESYEIVYASGATCTLAYDPGVTYTGGESIVAPVRAFVRAQALPPEAASKLAIP